jgi:hypothetical protein
MIMSDGKADWDHVHRSNFESAAFSEFQWIQKAKSLYEAAKKLEAEVVSIWENRQAHAKDVSVRLTADHYHGPYFMLIAFAVENLLKAAAVASNREKYRSEFRRSKDFPKELKSHNLVTLAKLVALSFDAEDEDLLRRLTRCAVWYGRYPIPLKYSKMSGGEQFTDGNVYSVSWFGRDDIHRLNTFVLSLPKRLGLYQRYWSSAAAKE